VNYQLGKAYLKGIYVQKDERRARKYLLEALKHYHDRIRKKNWDVPAYYRIAKIAQFNLFLNLNGKAEEYFTKAADVDITYYIFNVYQRKARKFLAKKINALNEIQSNANLSLTNLSLKD